MGIPVLILGESGTGKSASMRNLDPNRYELINVAGKPLPFKGGNIGENTDSYRKIKHIMKDTDKNIIVIDDAQYLMANEFMRRATERGYDKFTEIAQNFWELIQSIIALPAETIVYVMAHVERDQNGNEKIKTIGRMLDEKITVEGMFTIVLKTYVKDGKYGFLTQNSGRDTVKTPMGMFNSMEIDNDLNLVDLEIRDYYNFSTIFNPAKVDEYVKEEGTQKASRATTKKADIDKSEKTESVSETTQDNESDVPKEITETPVRRTRKRRA